MNQSTKTLVDRLFKMPSDERDEYIGALRTRLHLEQVVNALLHKEAELTEGVDEWTSEFHCGAHVLDQTAVRPPSKRRPLIKDDDNYRLSS